MNDLLKQYGQARKMMKSLSGNMGFLGKKLGKMGMGKLGLPGFSEVCAILKTDFEENRIDADD